MNFKQTHKLGVFNLTMLTLGSMIGAGIFVVPNALKGYGSAATLGWIIAALCALSLANTFSDLSVNGSGESFPLAISSTLGNLSGFMAAFNQWIFLLFASAEIVFTASNYLMLYSGLSSRFLQFFLIATLSIMSVFLHSRSRIGLKLVEWITSVKLLLFTIISILGILSFNFKSSFGGLKFNLHDFINAIKAASVTIFAFAGLDSSAAKASDARDPKRTVPAAINISTLICSTVYLLTHFCVMSSGTQSETPVVSAMQILGDRIFGISFTKILSLIGIFVGAFGCLGTFLAVTFISPATLEDAMKIANPSMSFRKTRTGVPIYIASLQCLLIVIMSYLKYITRLDLGIVLQVASFSLVVFYFYCVMLSLSSRPKRIGFPALLACGILFSGCSLSSVFLGSVLQMLGQACFVLNLRRRNKKTIEDEPNRR